MTTESGQAMKTPIHIVRDDLLGHPAESRALRAAILTLAITKTILAVER